MSTTPADERRRKRSDDPLVALHYQLAHARTEGRFDAVVVADGSGVVVAGAGRMGHLRRARRVRALCSPRASGPSRASTTRRGSPSFAREVDVQPVDVDGQTVLLCSRGGGRRTGAMDRAAAWRRADPARRRVVRRLAACGCERPR